jgi:uncharacterized protein YabN with tetrapyrrole methylase and pyrophosphatase domain
MNLLNKIEELENEAAGFGFAWETAEQIIEQVKSECEEITAHLEENKPNRTLLEEEIGDLLHAAFSLCIFSKFDPQQTLQNATDKFETRLKAVKALATQQGLTTLKGHSFEELMALWEKAKQQVG